MNTHLKKFSTYNEYTEYMASSGVLLPNVSLITTGQDVKFTPDPFNGVEYVDLGLPSGTLWAKCNIGASNENEIGSYFQWGDTVDVSDVENSDCDYVNYKWGVRLYAKDVGHSYTKYNNTDNLRYLLPSDDTATILLGNNWHMPDSEAFHELFSDTYVSYQYLNDSTSGYYGLLLTSLDNGNTLFLPYTGYRDDSEIYDSSSVGDYWSRDLASTFRDGIAGTFTPDEMSKSYVFGTWVGDYDRLFGMPIRPVVGPRMTGK